MLLAFICSEFSLSHYFPKVRFFDTAVACLALHPSNDSPGNLSQNKISCLWHQGWYEHQNSWAWPPSHRPPATPSSVLWIRRSAWLIQGCIPAQPPCHPTGILELGYSLMQIREWQPVLFYTGTSCYATDLTLWALSSSLIALLWWKATGRYNLGSISIVFTPPIIPAGLPTSWRGPDEKLRTQCFTFKLQACSSNQSSLWRWIWSEWLWLNWVLSCLEQAVLSGIALLCEEFV